MTLREWFIFIGHVILTILGLALFWLMMLFWFIVLVVIVEAV